VVPNVDVVGHTDTTGPAEGNDTLSLERARSVSRLLDALSLPPERLQVSGRGERQLLVQTPDETAEPENRRVEITIY
jgi:outer membrane protein OmpA-like peptidoglycan-associated protein